MDIGVRENGVLIFEDLKVDTATHQAWRGEREVYLSGREYELLLVFLDNPRHILSKKTLYEAVWKKEYTGNGNLLEVYVSYLRNKLELGREPQIVFTVRGYGYILR